MHLRDSGLHIELCMTQLLASGDRVLCLKGNYRLLYTITNQFLYLHLTRLFSLVWKRFMKQNLELCILINKLLKQLISKK